MDRIFSLLIFTLLFQSIVPDGVFFLPYSCLNESQFFARLIPADPKELHVEFDESVDFLAFDFINDVLARVNNVFYKIYFLLPRPLSFSQQYIFGL